MSEEAVFFRQAAEAIVATSLNASNLDPTIRELLSRIKYVNPNLKKIAGKQDFSASNAGNKSPINEKEVGPNLNNNNLSLANRDLLLDYFADPFNKAVASSSNSVKNLTSGVSSLKNHRKNNKSEKSNIESGNENTGDEKKFFCAKCSLVFRRSSDLRRHERTHLPVLPNICSQCGKGFARKDALKRHFNTLTCKRNRNKLLSIGGDINEILERARQTGTGV